jgi:hypothetical protein
MSYIKSSSCGEEGQLDWDLHTRAFLFFALPC